MSSVINNTLDASGISAQRIIAAWIFGTTSFLGVVGNILVIIAVGLSRQLQTSTNIFVVALAIIDLLNCLLLPVQVMSLLGVGRSVAFERFCTVAAVFMSIFLGVSVSILTLIAYNRYYMITKRRVDYNRLYTRINTSFMIVVVGGAISTFNIVVSSTGLATFGLDEGMICSHVDGFYYSYPSGAWLLISLIVIVVCYVKIYKHIKRHLQSIGQEKTSAAENVPEKASESPSESPQNTDMNEPAKVGNAGFGQRQRELESKITTNMLIIIVLFFLCVFPSIIILFIPKDHKASGLTVAMIAFNSCVNPIVYAWKHPVFRHVFKCILSRKMSEIKEPTQWARSLIVTNS